MSDDDTSSDDIGGLERYLDSERRITRLPGKRRQADLPLICDYLVSKFAFGRTYTEREVNDILRQWHTFGDWALLRRELYERGLLNREKDGSLYWRTPQTKLY
jgi:hypothetical protein